MKLFLTIFLMILLSLSGHSNNKSIEVGIDEQLGKYLPLDKTFIDEDGKPVILKDLFTKPTILSFVYYNCPGICSPLLMELSDIIGKSDLVAGVDYNVVSISMDQLETSKDAAERKARNNFAELKVNTKLSALLPLKLKNFLVIYKFYYLLLTN